MAGSLPSADLKVTILEEPSPKDYLQIGELAELSFIRFGHYREFITALVRERGVVTVIIREPVRQDDIVGFLLLGFIPVAGSYIADIMAIALEEAYQGRGLGKQLMDWAMEAVERVSRSKEVRELRLTVAHDNKPAVSLFRRYGFAFDRTTDLGNYPSGVPASSMKVYYYEDEE